MIRRRRINTWHTKKRVCIKSRAEETNRKKEEENCPPNKTRQRKQTLYYSTLIDMMNDVPIQNQKVEGISPQENKTE